MVVFFEQSRSFPGFFKAIVHPYQILGISPKYHSIEETPGKLKLCSSMSVSIFVVFYWIAIGCAFGRKGDTENSVSIFSNYVQLLINAIALTATLVNPLRKYLDYHEILRLFNKIDLQLDELGKAIDYRKQIMRFYGFSIAFLAILIYNYAFDFYVSVYKSQTEVSYWLLHSIPLILYALSLHQAVFFIFCIHNRLCIASELLQQPTDDVANDHKPKGNGRAVIQVQGIFPCTCSDRLKCTGKCKEAKDAAWGEKVFQVVNDLFLVCGKVDSYFGPVLLLTLAALFVVTSIQSFYCFTFTANYDPTNKGSVWYIISCMNLIAVNMALVISLSYASETVTNDADCILTNVLQPKNRASVNEFHNWFHPMLSRIRFTACGFFHINYNMLFGFTSALITYLIILVQFNSLSKTALKPPTTHTADKEGLKAPPMLMV